MSPRRNWDSPTLSLASECAPPPGSKGGGDTRLRMRGWGSPNSSEWSKSLALCLLLGENHHSIWLCTRYLKNFLLNDVRYSSTSFVIVLFLTESTLLVGISYQLWRHLHNRRSAWQTARRSMVRSRSGLPCCQTAYPPGWSGTTTSRRHLTSRDTRERGGSCS